MDIKTLKEKLEELRISKGKATRIAEFVGKAPRTNGAIPQARRDGYDCALAEVDNILKMFEEK
jgi:hypothetical protein